MNERAKRLTALLLATNAIFGSTTLKTTSPQNPDRGFRIELEIILGKLLEPAHGPADVTYIPIAKPEKSPNLNQKS